MGHFLFFAFIFNTICFLFKRMFASLSVSLKSKVMKRVGVTIYVLSSQLYSIIRSILLFLSVDYIYFKGFYYYTSIISITGSILITIVLLFSFLLMKQNKDIPKLENKVNENSALSKIKDKFIFGIIFRIILGVAWLKTFNYFEIYINSITESIVVAILYLLVLTLIMSVALKKEEQNSSHPNNDL